MSARDFDDLLRGAKPLDATVEFDPRLRLGTVVGTAGLGLFLLYLYLGCEYVNFSAPTPEFFLILFGMLKRTVDIGGYAWITWRIALAALTAATGLAIATRGFSWGRRWQHVTAWLVAALGLIAMLAPLIALLVLAVNAAIWVTGGVLFALAAYWLIAGIFAVALGLDQ